MTVPDRALALLAAQSHLATRRQLLALGVTRATIDWHIGRTWRYALPCVVQARAGDLDSAGRHVAALLYAGDGALLAGPTAATYFGLRGLPADPQVHVLVSGRQRERRVRWVQVHRSAVTEPRPLKAGERRWTSKARAVLDAARWADADDEGRAVVIQAVQRRIVRLEDLARELDRGPRQGSARLRVALAEAGQGSWSVPEADLLGMLARSRILPAPMLNPRLHAGKERLIRPDVWFDDVGLAVMVHSWQYHAEGDNWSATVERDGELSSHGVTVVGVTPRALRKGPDRVMRCIERAYTSARARPRPDVIATPRLEPWRRATA